MKKYIIVLICLFISAPLQAQDRVTLLLDWFINPDHGPIIIAQEKGYFADAGLEAVSYTHLTLPTTPYV